MNDRPGPAYRKISYDPCSRCLPRGGAALMVKEVNMDTSSTIKRLLGE
ncbi:MAG: hypothetical protein ACLUI3_12775 [Christensenellales bacterium]